MIILQMKEHGQLLGSRTLGERVRAQILGAVRGPEERVVLDFTGVTVMTQSFADEALRKLRETLSEAEAAKIVVRNASGDVLSVIRYSTFQAGTPPASPTHR